jgi:hypothetical protein
MNAIPQQILSRNNRNFYSTTIVDDRNMQHIKRKVILQPSKTENHKSVLTNQDFSFAYNVYIDDTKF